MNCLNQCKNQFILSFFDELTKQDRDNSFDIQMEEFDYCMKCGSNHEGECSAEVVYFYYLPSPFEPLPQEVFILGDWTLWGRKEKMALVNPSQGAPFFSILLALSEGVHQYKFLVDGQWKIDHNSPTVCNNFGSLNNVVEILPTKSFKKKTPGQRLKITSNFCMKNLLCVGSWDNWEVEHPMTIEYNPLKKCEQNVLYLDLKENCPYQFVFKHLNQYFVDEKYPTVKNDLGTINNIIVIYSKQITTSTPRKTETSPTPAPELVERVIKGSMFAWRKVQTRISLPYERVEGHSMCYVGQNLYIFGGKSRSQFYSTFIRLNSTFDKISFEEVVPDGRACHFMKSYGNKILIYGGHNKELLDDFNTFNVSCGKWTESHPMPKSSKIKNQKQSCVFYESLLVFFGGFCIKEGDQASEELTNAIEVLDIETMQWVESILFEGENPVPRYSHAAQLLNNDMYVFGGISDVEKNTKLNDLWKINLMNVGRMKWQQVKPKGTPPQARHGHTMDCLSNLLIIFGGMNSKGQYMNDVAIYNSSIDTWVVPLVQGTVPRGRVNHASANYFEKGIVIFGGRTLEKGSNNEFYIFEPTDFSERPLKLFDDDDDSDE